MHIAFMGLSAGVSVANLSALFLAIGETGHTYDIYGSGGGQTLLTGAFRSTEHLGSDIPKTDADGHRFPTNLQLKTVVFEVSPGLSLYSPHRIKLKIQSLGGRQATLYDWEGRVPLNTSCFGGFSIDGTARRPLDSAWEVRNFRYLMGYSSRDAELEDIFISAGGLRR